MTDKRKQKLRTLLGPSVHAHILEDFTALLSADDPTDRYLLEHLTSKYVGPDTDPAEVRKERAIAKWLHTEQRNQRTNHRLIYEVADFGFATSDEVIEVARRFVLKVIGADVGTSLHGSFSNGASTRYKRGPGNAALKFMGQVDVTAEAWPHILPMILECTTWWTNNPEVLNPFVVGGNVMFTVPKRTDIDRVACKEPELNMYAQKAVGDHIRRRLKRFGIDLNDQSTNRDLARQGSKTGKLATIDLSSASDSVSTTLVARLLPPGWFVLLDAIRSKRTLIGDDWHENHMFSSMGNGFTFELESLIFYSLARAIAALSRNRGRISVYGDDIIVPTTVARAIARCFSFFGFSVNSEKSFWSGPIRESCGGHYHRGADVTPFYVKEPIDSVERLIHFLNRLRKWAGHYLPGVCDPRFYDLWAKYAKLVDRRLWGGDDLADPTRLVSPHKGRFRLARVKDELTELTEKAQLGLYLQSLNSCDSRDAEPTEGLAMRYQNQRGQWFAGRGVNLLSDAVDHYNPERTLLTESLVLTREQTTRWVLRRVEQAVWVKPFPVWLDPDGGNL